jgi:hypothetical protein
MMVKVFNAVKVALMLMLLDMKLLMDLFIHVHTVILSPSW